MKDIDKINRRKAHNAGYQAARRHYMRPTLEALQKRYPDYSDELIQVYYDAYDKKVLSIANQLEQTSPLIPKADENTIVDKDYELIMSESDWNNCDFSDEFLASTILTFNNVNTTDFKTVLTALPNDALIQSKLTSIELLLLDDEKLANLFEEKSEVDFLGNVTFDDVFEMQPILRFSNGIAKSSSQESISPLTEEPEAHSEKLSLDLG